MSTAKLSTGQWVSAATMATSLLWTLGTRVNSNLIEAISLDTSVWVRHPDVVTARRLLNQLVNTLSNVPRVESLNALEVESLNALDKNGRAEYIIPLRDIINSLHSVFVGISFGPDVQDKAMAEIYNNETYKAFYEIDPTGTIFKDVNNLNVMSIRDFRMLLESASFYPDLLNFIETALPIATGLQAKFNEGLETNLIYLITTPTKYYTKDSTVLKSELSSQLNYLAYSTQAVSIWQATQNDNPLYLLFNCIPLTVLSIDIVRNYIPLLKKSGKYDNI